MIRSVDEAYKAMHGHPPDAETAARLRRIMAAAGATRERDPLAGVVVLLDAYASNMQESADAVRTARAELADMEKRIHAHIDATTKRPPSIWQRLWTWLRSP